MQLKRLRKLALRLMQVQILPAVFLCAATSLIVLGSTATLIVTAPFMPDTEEEGLKKVALQFSVPLLGGAVWLLGAMVVLTQLQNWELEDELEQVEQRYLARLGEIESRKNLEQQHECCEQPTPPRREPARDTSCTSCKYWASNEQAINYLDHPCTVHPTGRPGDECADWRAK